MGDQLSKPTSIFGLKSWVVLGVCVGAAFVFLLFLITLCLASKRSKKSTTNTQPKIPTVSKEIQEVKPDHPGNSQPDPEIVTNERQALLLQQALPQQELTEVVVGGVGGGGKRWSSEEVLTRGSGADHMVADVSHLGWGRWYTLRELEEATNGFADGNVVGEGGYGIVYYGLLSDGNQVAVKNLLNNRGQAEREFKVEVEAIGRVRHRNLVRLLGYCAEGAQRMLVYEYVNNGNLEQWLHGEVGPCSPLTWEIRMHIILGTAKGLNYLHEGLEPKVIHRDIKSSNILLDKQWNPKVSDFGLAKLIGSEMSHITTRVMGTFGYVAPEYASTGMLNESSDIYSFGILIMEIISGRNPVDYARPTEEVHLVEWLKRMVTAKNPEAVLDLKLPEKPTSRALKRALLVALKCVDPNAEKRPKMGYVVHMLEANESSLKEDQKSERDIGNPRERQGKQEEKQHTDATNIV